MTQEQVVGEIQRVAELIDEVYQRFGFSYHVELSTRGQPHRKLSCVVLDQNPHETLDGTEQNPVYHDRSVRLSVRADILHGRHWRRKSWP